RTPPLPTLFPYTTLFRSAGEQGQGRVHDHHRGRYDERRSGHPGRTYETTAPADPRQADDRPRPYVQRCAIGDRGRYPDRGRTAGDRKSTRLNSSHVAISY